MDSVLWIPCYGFHIWCHPSRLPDGFFVLAIAILQRGVASPQDAAPRRFALTGPQHDSPGQVTASLARDHAALGYLARSEVVHDGEAGVYHVWARCVRRASEKGLLPIRLEEYLSLLDWTGRVVRQDKKGAVPTHLVPILERLEINVSVWTELVTEFDQLFGRVVGSAQRVAARAAEAGRRWSRGQPQCARAFG